MPKKVKYSWLQLVSISKEEVFQCLFVGMSAIRWRASITKMREALKALDFCLAIYTDLDCHYEHL